ncbi:AaceriAFR028Wp [[Ashbya] aceris (nom. inval.)]|nr:AaceriAFR028Wp [[Ashbya] aceris (nom. inval.)]
MFQWVRRKLKDEQLNEISRSQSPDNEKTEFNPPKSSEQSNRGSPAKGAVTESLRAKAAGRSETKEATELPTSAQSVQRTYAAGLRVVPLMQQLLARTVYVFSSENSYQNYKKNGRDAYRSLLLASTEGEILGHPLYKVAKGHTLSNMFKRNVPMLKIYKYVVVSSGSEPPTADAQLISLANDLALYEVPFCAIFCTRHFLSSIVEYTLTFQRDDGPAYVKMRSEWGHRSYDAMMDGLNVRWSHRSSFVSFGGRSNFKLVVLQEDMPNLFSEGGRGFFDSFKFERSLSALPVLAEYTTDNASILPRQMMRLAEVEIPDSSYLRPSDFNAVPWNIEVIICMSALIREVEDQRSRRSSGDDLHTTQSMGLGQSI